MKSVKLKRTLATLTLLSVMLFSQVIFAENFEMSVVLDRAHGGLVQQGAYEDAITQIASDHRMPFAASNNLCVAYTKMDKFDQAALSCDVAVQLAEFAAENGHRTDVDYVTELAIALSNRGVLRAFTGDPEGAEEDFRKAAGLNPNTDCPVQNLSHLMNGKSVDLAKN